METETEVPAGTEIKKRSRKKLLHQTILKQMEFYFSSANLSKDRFLSLQLQKGSVPLSVFLNFNRIRALTSDVKDLAKALRRSELLEVSEDDMTVKRTQPVEVKENADDCVIYVEQLQPDADHDWLREVFSSYGEIDYVSIPKFKSGKIKGFAFIEFSHPESAQKAIKDYQKEGNYLPVDMTPDELCSIRTFENESAPSKEDNPVAESDQENIKKRKRSEDGSSDVSEKGVEGDLDEVNVLSHEDNSKLCKKLKSNGNKYEEVNSELEATLDEGKECKEGEMEEGNENSEETKKKKHRKKKKRPKKDKISANNSGLQILSKKDWKVLRNRYLNIQRERMKLLKKHLVKKQQRAPQVTDINCKPVSDSEFVPGLIVKVTLPEPIVDIKIFKDEAKAYSSVKYVDVKEGESQSYLRLESPEAAQEICNFLPWSNMEIISGKEEEQYWKKIEESRASKLQKSKKVKERGKNKLVKKAEKALGKHIVFEDLENE